LSPLLCVIGTIFIDEQITHQSDLIAPYVDVGQVKYENPFFRNHIKMKFRHKSKTKYRFKNIENRLSGSNIMTIFRNLTGISKKKMLRMIYSDKCIFLHYLLGLISAYHH
jgi:hypothetical protein